MVNISMTRKSMTYHLRNLLLWSAGVGLLITGCSNTVDEPCVHPTVTSTAPLNATFDREYSYTVVAIGDPDPVYRLAEGPAGMTLDSVSGDVSWTPQANADPECPVSIEAVNDCGVVAQTFVIMVAGLPIGPVITSEPSLSAAVGEEYSYAVTVTGDPVPTIQLWRAPAGMTLDPSTRLISWTPTLTGSHDSEVEIRASNIGGTFSQTFIIQTAGLNAEGWETGSMVDEGINAATVRGVADMIEDGTYPQINSMLIIRNGKLVFEAYFNGYFRNRTENIYSAEKTITSCLMGIAIDQGVIADENERLYPFYPEYDSFENWTDWKDSIRLRHLLTMTAGYELEGDDYDLWRYNIGPRDWIKFYLDLPVTTQPGTAIDYKSMYDRLAGNVIEREAGVSLPDFAVENLFGPLGMAYYDWSGWDPVNNSMISAQLELRPIDMAKIGQTYLDDGLWRGNRIVSEEWVNRSTTVNMGNYGYNWWIYEWATNAGLMDVYYAFGNGGNGIFVFESLQMIVVFTGDYFVQPDYWQNQQEILKQQLVPAAVYGP